VISAETLDAAVAGGVITSVQRDRLLALESSAASDAEAPEATEENLRLIGGGNDLFVTVGAVLLMAGFYFVLNTLLAGRTLPVAAALAVVLWVVAEIVTRQHRMKLSSTVLSLFFMAAAVMTGAILFILNPAKSFPNSTATSSARRTPSAPWRLRCEIVSELDRFIIGQKDAKRAVAIALRNRWRRQQLDRPDARRGDAEEHPDDRPDRRRQDRDLPPPGQACRRALHQGRGDQVHRGRLCRPRRRADRARPGRGRDRPDREKMREDVKARAHLNAEERVLEALVGKTASPRPATVSARSCATANWTTRRSRSRSSTPAPAACRASRFPACRAPMSA
jgi:hypothetical protein